MEEDDSIVTDEQEGAVEETGSDPKGRNAVLQSILERNFAGPQEEEPTTPELEEEEITLKVLGNEEKATKAEVLEAGDGDIEVGKRVLQKERAANEKLKLINEREQELQRETARRQQEINARVEDLRRLEESLLTKQRVEPDQLGRKFAEAILTDDDTVAEVITSLNRDIQALKQDVTTVRNREEQKERETTNNIVKHFHTGYQDIATDEVMTFAFNKFRADVLQAEPDPFKATEKAALMTYQKFGIIGETAKPSTPADVKRKLAPQVQRASARVKTPDPPKTKTHSEELDEMRKSRSMK
jgi:hypothetical protein